MCAVLRTTLPDVGAFELAVGTGGSAFPHRPGPGWCDAQFGYPHLRVLPREAPFVSCHHHVLRLYRRVGAGRLGFSQSRRGIWLALGTHAGRNPAPRIAPADRLAIA